MHLRSESKCNAHHISFSGAHHTEKNQENHEIPGELRKLRGVLVARAFYVSALVFLRCVGGLVHLRSESKCNAHHISFSGFPRSNNVHVISTGNPARQIAHMGQYYGLAHLIAGKPLAPQATAWIPARQVSGGPWFGSHRRGGRTTCVGGRAGEAYGAQASWVRRARRATCAGGFPAICVPTCVPGHNIDPCALLA